MKILLITFAVLTATSCSHVDYRQSELTPIEELTTRLNITKSLKDACDNFNDYACTPIGFGEGALIKSQQEYRSLARKELLSPIENSDCKTIQNIKTLYSSCRKHDTKHMYSIDSVLESYGSAPFIDASWSSNSFDWVNNSARLTLFGTEPFINVEFNSQFLNVQTFLLVFSPEFSDSVEFKHNLKFFARKRNKTEEINDIENFSNSIQKYFISKKLESVDVQEITYGIIKEKFPTIDWDLYLTTKFGHVPGDNEKVALFEEEKLQQIIDFISKSDQKIVANYLFNRFTIAYQKMTSCWEKIFTEFPDIFAAIYMNKHMTSDTKVAAYELFSELKESLRDVIQASDWIDETTKSKIRHKLNIIHMEIGSYSYTYSLDELDKKYDITFSSDKYLNIFPEFKKTKNKFLYENFKNFDYQVHIDSSAALASYIEITNAIMVCPMLFDIPLYHKDYPKAIIMGGLGSYIGHELGHTVDPHMAFINATYYVEEIWTDELSDIFNNQTKCLVSQYEEIYKQNKIPLSGEDTLTENFADHIGIKVSLNAYKNWLEKNRDNDEAFRREKIPGLDFSEMQLFYLGYAQLYCARNFHKYYKTYSPSNVRVFAALQNEGEFSKVFNCSEETYMNPDSKCLVF